MWKSRTSERGVVWCGVCGGGGAQPSKYKKDRQIYEGLMSHHKRKANTARCAFAEWVRAHIHIHKGATGDEWRRKVSNFACALSSRARNKMRFWFYGCKRCEIDFGDARTWFLEHTWLFTRLRLGLGDEFAPRLVISSLSWDPLEYLTCHHFDK